MKRDLMPKRKLSFLFILLLPTLLVISGCGLWKGPEGYWYGFVNVKDIPYRCALRFEKNSNGTFIGHYDSSDVGFYGGIFENVSYTGRALHANSSSGVTFDLNLNLEGNELLGTFSGKVGNIPVTLKQGMDFVIPRVGTDGKGVQDYQYQVPQKRDDGWEVADLRKDGVDIKKLESAVNEILDMDLSRIDSLVIVKNGKLVLDEYFYNYGPDDEHQLRSITKSVFSTLFGIAQGQDLVNTGQKLYDFFPQYRSESGWQARKNKITLGMVLTMTSGVACDDWVPPAFSCLQDMYKFPDLVDFCLSEQVNHEPGKHFAYCGSCLTPLAAILKEKSGMSVPDYAQKYLYGPMGIQANRWEEGPNGITEVEGSHWLKPRDMAKLGLLYLNKGKWNGQQIVPEKWVEDATSMKVTAEQTKRHEDYGYLWWIHPISFNGKKYFSYAAQGLGGQFIWVVPDLNVVAVITGSNYQGDNTEAKMTFFQDQIIPALF